MPRAHLMDSISCLALEITFTFQYNYSYHIYRHLSYLIACVALPCLVFL